MSSTVPGPPVNPNDSVNGRTIPAVPSGVNGNPDHNRKPSMTVTSAGATYNSANGGPHSKVSNITFGSTNAASSPAMSTPQMAYPATTTNLGVNPRDTQGSPSPIPQPAGMSGGRPPSAFQGQVNGVSFGQTDNNDSSGLARPMQNMSFNQQEHIRRGSSQSIHSDMGNPSLPTGPNRNNYQQGGRGRDFRYSGSMNYPPHSNFRPQGRGGPGPQYPNQGRHQVQYQGSPQLGTRSPMMPNASPGPGQMPVNQMQMMPGMQGQPTPYYVPQGYGVPTQADPSISYMYNMNYSNMQPSYNQFAPPSPRPPYQQANYGNQMQSNYGHQGPQSMSRQSSQMSATTDRPASSMAHTPHTPSAQTAHSSARTPSMSQAKSEFNIPTKKSAAIVIKNPNGEVVDLSKKPSAAAATPSSTAAALAAPAAATPPSRTGSAADHTRSESSVKTDEEKKKAMQEAVARKVAEEKAQKEKEAAEQKAQMDKEAAEAAQREADAKQAEAERLEKETKEAEAKKEAESKPPVDDDEPDFDAIEAELAAQEAEEARREEEYQKKKAAQREAQAKREQEEAAAYEANMKEAERKAEEEELAREKKRAEGISDDAEAKRMFAALKGDGATPASTSGQSPVETPAESGAVTPVSDASMPPPKSTGSKRGKLGELTLDTKKSTEPPEPSAALKSLEKARPLSDPTAIAYPEGVTSPDAALNANVSADRRFVYSRDFLLQFKDVFKDKPSRDWDVKVRESLGDGDAQSARGGSNRTPSGMGNRSTSQRGLPQGQFGGMGQFGAGRPPVGRGTTSDERFAAANAAMGRGGSVGSFQMGRGGIQMGRTPSNNPFGSMPGSPRPSASHRGGRTESKRNKQSSKQEAEANKAMPLTAGMNITTLETTTTGWKPRSIGQPQQGPTPGGDGLMEPDVVQRKVKAALNKMTPEKFDKIADQILEIAGQSKHESDGRTLRQVIQLTFEKATDEAHWASMYAMFCAKMLQTMSPEIRDENIKDKNGQVVAGGNLFRKYLLNRCQEEFERGWKVNLPSRKEGESEEAAMMSEEYYQAAAAKRRGLGLVKFIGELYKLGMLTERIMHECVKKLLDYEGTPEEAEVESLTSLLRTIGKQLDSSESRAQGRMDIYFQRIEQTMNIPDLPSRLRFMLLDIVDLRKSGWVSKQDNKGPKTIQEIRAEAEAEAQRAELARIAQQGGRGGGGRMPMGRGDARSFSGYGQVPPPDNSNRVGADDLRRLGGRQNRNASSQGPSLGPPSLLGPRTNSGRRGLGPGGFVGREDSNASSRTGTPPAQKEKDKKDESSTNAFSALAALEGADHEDPSSPPTQQSQPDIEQPRPLVPDENAE